MDLASTFRLSTLLPHASRLSGYYRYQGSLTTPDCSEVVVWTVFEEPVEIGQEQVLVCTAPCSGTQRAEPSGWPTRSPSPLCFIRPRGREIDPSTAASSNPAVS